MLRQLGALVVVCLVTIGPQVVLLTLLNLRDRREDQLMGTVATALFPMRTTVSFRVHCAVCWPASAVRLDMWMCTPDEMWQTSLRVLESLPPGVRLVVEGPLSGHLVGSIALVARRRAVRGPHWQTDSRDVPSVPRAPMIPAPPAPRSRPDGNGHLTDCVSWAWTRVTKSNGSVDTLPGPEAPHAETTPRRRGRRRT